MRPLLVCLLLALAWPAAAFERVVSLAPSLSEIMLELDAAGLLVGVLDGGERPAALAHLPSVGRYGQLELESLLALKPDLVLLWPGSISASQREQLKRFGIPLYEAEPHSLEALGQQVLELGRRLNRAQRAEQLAADFQARLSELRRRYRRAVPLRVFYQIWDTPLYTIGNRQIIGDALRVCGAENLFADLPLPAPQVSVEAVLARDPQVILLSSPGLAAAWQAWPQLTAVQRRQVWAIPDKGLERPSLQMLGATEKLCQLLARAP
ncbi:cobalamin-binding protein [Pseudomonas sp. 2FG]|uniref:cobalamin-binding protein n=1 Tax=Pseudomonas sp. 2FG TaxID=2502191 RepID=UPI0010F8802E|nr:cobalamin-binding protein [Pseudomonas sp. 2FG]